MTKNYLCQNTGVDSLSLLQRIFPNQESNRGLLHCSHILYQLSYQGTPIKLLHDSEMSLLSIYSKEMKIYVHLYMNVLVHKCY